MAIALAEVAEVDVYTVSRILDRREVDPLAVICRAADLDGPLFLTNALTLQHGDDQARGRARSFAMLYAELSGKAARRTLRFWRLRRTLG